MEIRLNKLISEAGICSRREADEFILQERVTVNGLKPQVGQKITLADVILVDGERIYVDKFIRQQATEAKKDKPKAQKPETDTFKPAAKTSKKGEEDEAGQPAKFGKYNKYAAARKALREGGWKPKAPKITEEEKLLRKALQPGFGKSLKRSAVAQRIAANPKSAALRKNSKNNPINKAKRIERRKNTSGEHSSDE